MGNGGSALSLCISGGGRRRKLAAATAVADEGLGHSFCYIRPESGRPSTCRVYSDDFSGHESMPFRSISGAYVGANSSSCLLPETPVLFESSPSFASIPLQPVPRSSTSSTGGAPSSGSIERGFVSGPIERAFLSGPVHRDSYGRLTRLKKSLSVRRLRVRSSLYRTFAFVKWRKKKRKNSSSSNGIDNICDDFGQRCSDYGCESGTVQWAQGKAGEDRVHIVIYEENGWVFVGIYDGFNGPDAPDFLMANLFKAVDEELKQVELQKENIEPCVEDEQGSTSVGYEKMNKKKKKNKNSRDYHTLVLNAMEAALRMTEAEFLEVSERAAVENPELALMGSCVLVMVMRGEDVYLMNVGDSRVVLARVKDEDTCVGDSRISLDRIREETPHDLEFDDGDDDDDFPRETVSYLTALQLTVDHSTEVEEEVNRLVKEHPEDSGVIINERVKGSLKVTRAFGAGYLKQPKMNDALLGPFKVDYVGSSPYLTCSPSLYHYQLTTKDKFLILSSDGLYQYFTNEEVVSEIEMFLESFPEGDPAQYLIEGVLFRAAKKAGMDFHELLEISQGDRRRYHDDVSVIVISLEGRIWRSSV